MSRNFTILEILLAKIDIFKAFLINGYILVEIWRQSFKTGKYSLRFAFIYYVIIDSMIH